MLIVGGGLVGASLGVALDRIGVDIGLVEAAPAGALPAVFDERNLSFAEATVNALTALGVLQKLRAPTGAIRRIHASRSGNFGRVRLEAGDYGREAFGQVVVARDFGEALEARLGELAHLTRYRPARFVGLDNDDDAHRAVRIVDGAGERVVRARLLVAADGTRSAVRDALGIAADEHDYLQTLFVARLRAERAPDGTAWERFGDDGPTALLPRGDRHYGLVHAVAREDAARVQALGDEDFLARVQRVFGWRAGRLLAVGARSTYPAIRLAARSLTAPRAVLVGNAAQTLHPIGAQGFNLGLRDALTLAELIEHQRRDLHDSRQHDSKRHDSEQDDPERRDPERHDPGDAGLLAAYAQRRREDRARTLAFTDGLVRLGANPAPMLAPLRSFGLLALDRLPSVQSLLVGGAMGYRGDVPALCRAEAR